VSAIIAVLTVLTTSLTVHERTAAAAPASAGTLGVWTPPEGWPNIAVHLVLLPNGKVLSWEAQTNRTTADVWDPTTGSHTAIAEIPFELFCSGHTLLADGKVFIPGGSLPNNDGIVQTHFFDMASMTFRRGPDMNAPRWYPGTVTLGSGEVLIVGGTQTYADSKYNTVPQVYQPANNTLRTLTGANRPFGPSNASRPTGTDSLSGYYPRMHVTPAGKVYMPSDGNKQSWLDVAGTGSWTDKAAAVPTVRAYNNSVLIQPNKALIVGGGWTGGITSGANLVDITTGQITPTGSMSTSRKWQNSVILPTGSVLTVGGEAQTGTLPDAPGDPGHAAVLFAESWDPSTGAWTRRGNYTKQRYYHSSALLLPDGRVVSVGGGQGQGFSDQKNAEVYTPWYLYKNDGSGTLAPRPVIASVNPEIAYGSSFPITTANAAAISRVTLVRLGAVTHAQDQNTRFLELPIASRTSTSITASLGGNRNEMPPGHYMLSIIDGAGVPSVSAIVKVGDTGGGTTTTTTAATTTTTAAATTTTAAATTTTTKPATTTTAATTTTTVKPPVGGGLVVFDDKLLGTFADWSWSTTRAINTTTKKVGTASLAVTPIGRGGRLSLRSGPALAAAPYKSVAFWTYGGPTQRSLFVSIRQTDNGAQIGVDVTIPANVWTQVVIPLTSLGRPVTIARIDIGTSTGLPEPTWYLDDLRLTP
jgi:hypothetical protein